MMHDPAYNFYDVVAAADAYFATHPTGKGSGFKGYQRWKHENESKYYPSGDRSNIDPYFASNAFLEFERNNPTQRMAFTNGWRDLGPYNANNVTSHYSPGIGRVEDIYIDENNTNLMYMGSRSGGFWRTTDGGTNWQNTTDYLVASGVNAIGVSPTNPDSVLINVRNATNGYSHGVYRSTDGGLTFTQSNFNPTTLSMGGLGDNFAIYTIKYHPMVPDLVFIGTNNGVYRSYDNLQNWVQFYPSGDITDIYFHPTDASVVYMYDDDGGAANPNALLVSTDFGVNFTASADLVGNNNSRIRIATSADCPDCVYGASGNGYWKSTDQGATFTFLSNPGIGNGGFAVSDVDTSSVLGGYLDLHMSTDGGNTFNQRTWWANGTPDSTYVHADLRVAKCINGVYYVGTDGYFAKSADNGLSWERLNDGTGIREFYRAGLSQSNWLVQMAGSQDNGTSILLENGWIEWNGGDGMEAVIQPLNDAWMIGSWQYGTRNRTKDKGLSRQGIGTPQGGDWVAPMFIDPLHQMRVFHFSDSVFKSEEFGTGWEYVGDPGIGNIQDAAVSDKNSDIMVVKRSSNLMLSTDAGQTFTSISSGLPNYTITDVQFVPGSDQILVVSFNRYQIDNQKVYISYNRGYTWINITGNLGNMPVRSLAIDHTPAHNIYVGAEIGVYTKPLSGGNWTLYNPNLPNVSINELEIQYGTNVLRAITWGRGLWEYSLVGRQSYPSVLTTNITDTPTDIAPSASDPQDVTSVISYNGTISSAFVRWSDGNTSLDSTIAMVNTIDSTWLTLSPIPNFVEGTDVYFKVFAVGSTGDTTETYRFHYVTRPACISNGNMSWQTSVTYVGFNDIAKSSGKPSPYSDYRDTDSTEVRRNEMHDLTTNVNTDGAYTVHSRVWVDWNHDGDFIDPGEEYEMGSANNTSNGPTAFSPLTVTVPATAALGHTNMRVSARYASPATPCETGYDGEVEDYLLIVLPECPTAVTNLTETACETYTSPAGNIYTASGNYSDTLSGAYGCDSIVAIDLTINAAATNSLNEVACDSFFFNNQMLYADGLYTSNLQTSNGCDSTVTLNLLLESIDNTLNTTTTTLTANEGGVSYQWLLCDNGYVPIAGENGQSFTATSNGQYALALNNGVCYDTSMCFAVTTIGLAELALSDVQVYPNPTSSNVTVDLGQLYSDAQVSVKDVLGRTIAQYNMNNRQQINIALDGAAAVYFLHVVAGTQEKTIRVIKTHD